MIRLQKYLAECGVASRRASERLIETGRVQVNGQVAELGCSVLPCEDIITVDDQPIRKDDKVYLVLNKPTDVITTAKDPHGRKTVLECTQGSKARVFPVGRLDRDVAGVLLLTNDGELAHRLMHPSHEVKKTYIAWVAGRVSQETADRLAAGVALEDGKTAPAEVAILEAGERATQLCLTLHEGRKHEVKRMCGAIGHPVRSLERVAFAGIGVNRLRRGEWRYLTTSEAAALRTLVNL